MPARAGIAEAAEASAAPGSARARPPTGRRLWRILGFCAALGLTIAVLAPILSLALSASDGSAGTWSHLSAHVLPRALADTACLLIGIGVLVLVIGTGTAWLVTAYAFRGRRFLEVALILPLAVPTYIVSFAYLDLLHPIGPLQTCLRSLLGYARPRDLHLPDIRSLPGCILLLGLVLYPYVYLSARACFLMQSANLVEAARCLGAGSAAAFLRVALPMARPALALGTGLALMEALNDIGAAELLGVRTLTVQVYTTWVNRSDLPGAAGIALIGLGFVVLLILAEQLARGGRRFAPSAHRLRAMERRPLPGLAGWGALVAGSIPVLLGFVLPAGYLVHLALQRILERGLPETLPAEILASLRLALLATSLCAAIGLLVAAAARWLPSRTGTAFVRIASLGYALPGIILAIGLLGALAWVDAVGTALGQPVAAWALGTGGLLVLAYVLRFLAIGTGAGETGLGRVPASMPDAARMLGRSRLAALRQVELPIAWPAIVSGALLVFVDCLKELPATLLLRPLNVETLATHVYAEAARGTYEDGAVAALLIVAVGLLPVAILMRTGATRSRAAR